MQNFTIADLAEKQLLKYIKESEPFLQEWTGNRKIWHGYSWSGKYI